MPIIHRRVEVQAWISRCPCGVTDLLPQIAGLQGLVDLAIGALDEVPVGVAFNSAKELVFQRDGIVRVLASNREVGFRIPVGVIDGEIDFLIALLGELDDALDVVIWHLNAAGHFDLALKRRVLLRIKAAFVWAIAIDAGLHNGFEVLGDEFGAGHKCGNLLLFLHLPIDIGFDIRMVDINDNHFGRATCRAARLDRARCPVADLEEGHEAR